ncbi:septum formation inhibitor MinC [Mesorhizobium sp. M7A.F.Ca.CA.001.07.2.1]|uniref:septum site-determining protein MinC n=3 Tax=Phyllobacteriaceae TaxID=69277 RepID=UPI000FCAEFB9|nr:MULTISPECIES: septum site-determining protein MinC [Mesorhizobium]MCQ8812674.1 septum site-determining protein MinC [Mesorhizobium sp. SEMIA396]MCF6122093.1 septum site-determining protein MinC [Mesorhizobium ciceri]RUX70362.1 septum formation inhibitor MinC [Mesorhizobium sp. M7A.F.Ca.CA.004.08.2.1]RUX87086.1 septum formation inhibitor MinC [Mesorhizobium sp. M7A.F.Ca.CA.004.08.1.1]RUX94904.1 septum formation inhibitor MinC [Mesorhizobium sp. M7A.F.Ca.CA.004.04.1.1]
MTFAAPLEAKSIRFRARSFVAFTLTPEAPLDVWLEGLDHWIGNSPGYFAGRPVVLDLNTLKPDVAAIESLVDVLGHRGIRIYAIELDGHAALAPNLPPVLVGAKEATTDGLLPRKAREDVSEEGKAEGRAPEAGAAKAGDGKVDASKAGDSEPQVEASGTLMIKAPIRSGQAIVHPHGDVIVLGSVASGSEIIAAGSIHVYGTLRGRASAGALGNRGARIFCRKNEAELLAVDGWYVTAEEMEGVSRGKPVQAFLDGDALRVSTLS